MTVLSAVPQLAGDSPVGSVIDVGLKTDQIMQRFLVRRIFREVEFRIKEADGEIQTGFITGFDERCIQLSTSPAHVADEPRAMLIYWPVRRIEETGRRLDDLDPEHRSKIRSYSHALRSQCEAVLSGNNPNSRRVRPVAPGQPEFSAL